jgi:RNA polymerase sigma factor (sigma-70 family)
LLGPDEEKQFWLMHSVTAEELFRKSYRMCGGHEADARDALQETYLKAIVHWQKVGAMDDLPRRRWLAKTLTNQVLQLWRAPHRSRENGFIAGDWEDTAAVTCSPSDLMSDYRRVCRAIASLKGREREVIGLHCLAGYELREVAKMLDIDASTVRVHLHHGRMRLRQILAAGGGDADGGA